MNPPRARHTELFGLLICLAFMCPAQAAPPAAVKSARTESIAKSIEPFIEQHEIAGAVTAVVSPQGIIELQAAGEADLAGQSLMRTDSVFWIASMTKPITATAIMMLQDEGKLSVEDPVSKYIPELADLKLKDGTPAKVTLRHMLTHTSGMGEASSDESRPARTLADLVPIYAQKPVQFPPGSKWQYCQSGINMLGRVVEVVSGQSLPDFLDRRLFAPLQMTDTTFYPSQQQMGRLAVSYKRTAGKLEPAKIFILDGYEPTVRNRYPAANGGLFSSAPDYARFCQMILNRGTIGGKRYLSPEAVAMMTSVQTPDLQTGFTPGNGWGLGWCVVRKPQGVSAMLSPGTFGHGGAYGTQAWIDPSKGRAYILMVQRADFPNSDDSAVRKAFQTAAAE